MSKIEIVFNRGSYITDYDEESIVMTSSFKYNELIKIESNVDTITFNNRLELDNLFEKLRGSDNDNLKLRLFQNNLVKWANANFYQQQAFKCLVLIFNWLELALGNPQDLDVSKNFYDEFVVDWNFRPGFQNTIFLLPEKYIRSTDTIKLLDNLVTVNLLLRINIVTPVAEYKNYFIPLLTPGVPLDYHKSDNDPDGTKSFNLWKQLLKDRDIRIKSWVDNRF